MELTLPPGPAGVIWTLLIATLLGFLIGLERERKRETRGSIFAGIRTFPLIALFGAIAGNLNAIAGPWPLVASILAMAALVSLSYWRESMGSKVGGTTGVAAFVAFGLGVLAGSEMVVPALAGAVLATAVLSMRDELRSLSTAVTRADLFAAVPFSPLYLEALPLLPD